MPSLSVPESVFKNLFQPALSMRIARRNDDLARTNSVLNGLSGMDLSSRNASVVKLKANRLSLQIEILDLKQARDFLRGVLNKDN